MICHLSVYGIVGFLYTVICSLLLSVYKRKFSIFLDFFGKLDVGILFLKVVIKSINFAFVNRGKGVVNVA